MSASNAFARRAKRAAAQAFPRLANWYTGMKQDVKDFLRLRKSSDPLIVYRQSINELEEINGVETNVKDHPALPETLLMTGSRYVFQGQLFDCRHPGLYRFIAPQHNQQQRVVPSLESPVETLLCLSLIALRGNSDHRLARHRLEYFCRQRFLRLTCGPLSSFLAHLLQQTGIGCRIVYSYTVNSWNTYNNGHVLLEVWETSLHKQVVVDVDKKAVFYGNGQLLSLMELTEFIHFQIPFTVQNISPVTLLDWSGFQERVTGFSYAFLEYLMHANSQGILPTLERICQIPSIEENGVQYACCWTREQYDFCRQNFPQFVFSTPQEFTERFYSNKHGTS